MINHMKQIKSTSLGTEWNLLYFTICNVHFKSVIKSHQVSSFLYVPKQFFPPSWAYKLVR